MILVDVRFPELDRTIDFQLNEDVRGWEIADEIAAMRKVAEVTDFCMGEIVKILKPGITGWAQVNGRNSITWEDKFRYDVWYVRNISFWLDVKILFLTVKKVFCREGISAEDSATMEDFMGTKEDAES